MAKRPKSKMTDFARHIEYFLLKYLPYERNLSEATVKSYRDVLVKFITFMEKAKGVKANNLMLTHLTRSNIQDFLSHLRDTGSKPSTCNHRLVVLWSLVKYLQSSEIQLMQQWQHILSINKMKEDEPVVGYLSVEAIAMLLSAPDRTTRNGRRHALILSLMYDLGARVQEIANLKVSDIRIYDNEVTVHIMGKGNKGRVVPLMGESVNAVKQYLKDWGLTVSNKANNPFFFNARGSKLTRSGITHILNIYVELCRREKPMLFYERVSCHKLRHSKAMHLLQAGVNLIYIRDLLGHSSVKTTEVYARVGSSFKNEALKKAYRGTTVETDIAPMWIEDPDLLQRLKML